MIVFPAVGSGSFFFVTLVTLATVGGSVLVTVATKLTLPAKGVALILTGSGLGLLTGVTAGALDFTFSTTHVV